MPATNPVEVVGAAIVDDLHAPTRLLSARRIEPPELAGFWELPGGKVEPGETHAEALHREICEELGVVITLGERLEGPLAGGRWRLSPRHVMTVHLAAVIEGTPRPIDEHDAVRWLDHDTLRSVDWLDGDEAVIDVLATLLR